MVCLSVCLFIGMYELSNLLVFVWVRNEKECLLCMSMGYSQLPRVGHHQFKDVVAVYRNGNAFVVLAELVKGDHAVCLLTVPLRHELGKDFVGVFLALLHVGVLRGVINLGDVAQSHLPVLVHVQLFVSSSHQLSTRVIHGILDGS